MHGNVVSLFERECSIQRRHQKIVEEAPSPAVTPELRASLGEAAVAAARAVGYVGAGTVEFVMAPDSSYAFLEMNTRLQVEHPVTELITGLDLVRLQILVASGEQLPDEALTPSINGHAIEVRLYAEDATNGFLPVTGTLRAFEIAPGVRVDSGVESGSAVSPYYDAMVAKVIAHAPSRGEAAATLAAALSGSRLHGVTTNRDLLVRILRVGRTPATSTDTILRVSALHCSTPMRPAALILRSPRWRFRSPTATTRPCGRDCRAAGATTRRRASGLRSLTVRTSGSSPTHSTGAAS
jgi:acetyl/propionyl-CoA carboxylase alpha subunit